MPIVVQELFNEPRLHSAIVSAEKAKAILLWLDDQQSSVLPLSVQSPAVAALLLESLLSECIKRAELARLYFAAAAADCQAVKDALQKYGLDRMDAEGGR